MHATIPGPERPGQRQPGISSRYGTVTGGTEVLGAVAAVTIWAAWRHRDRPTQKRQSVLT